MPVSQANRDHVLKATIQAKATLKPGDRIRFTRCGGLIEIRRFTGWDGNWIVAAPRLRDHIKWWWDFREVPALPLDDISARHVTHVNGRAVQFGGPRPQEQQA
jgi:hypothetical protein